MKRILIPIFLLTLLSCENQSGNQLRVVELEGTPYNRGFIHGRTLKAEIKEVISHWREASEAMHGMKMAEIKKDFLLRTNYVETIRTWSPELLDEIKGISEGCGIDYDTIFLFQVSEELESYGRELFLQRCTAIGVNKTADNPTYLAQNMDPPLFLQGYPTLLHIKGQNSDLESYVFTFPGFIGLNGVNNKSIGITCNGLPDFTNQTAGLPVSFVVRSILEKSDYEDAVEFVHKIQHAKAQNYIIGGKEKARCFECAPDEINEFIPAETSAMTWHTNHFLVNPYGETYCSRLTTMTEEIEKRNYKIGFEDIKTILSSRKRNAGRPISNDWTYGCTIMVLSEHPELYIAPGRPDKTEFHRFTFAQ